MTLKTPEIIVDGELPAHVRDGVGARFETVHRPWEAEDPDAALVEAAGAEILATMAHSVVDAGLMDRLPRLKLVANFGVGYDTVDARAAAARGIVVTNTPDVLTEEVADTAWALLLMTLRELTRAEAYLRAGRWAAEGVYPLTRLSLRGRKIGILGLGRIGKAIAARATASKIAVAYHGRAAQEGVPYDYHASLHDMARAVDTLIVAAPGGAGTTGLVDAAILDALGPEGVVVNIARGSVIDEPALIAALGEGRIAAAGLDVFAGEPHVPDALLAAPNAVLLPHVGSASVATRRAMGDLFFDNILACAEGRAPLTPVAETPFTAWRG